MHSSTECFIKFYAPCSRDFQISNNSLCTACFHNTARLFLQYCGHCISFTDIEVIDFLPLRDFTSNGPIFKFVNYFLHKFWKTWAHSLFSHHLLTILHSYCSTIVLVKEFYKQTAILHQENNAEPFWRNTRKTVCAPRFCNKCYICMTHVLFCIIMQWI